MMPSKKPKSQKYMEANGASLQAALFLFSCSAFITVFSSEVRADYYLFNPVGERILIKDDGTWENLGIPGNESGISVMNVSLRNEDYISDGEDRQRCEVTIEIRNNSPYDLKKFGVSYDVFDDYDSMVLFMFSDSYSVSRLGVGETKNAKHKLPGACENYLEGGWYISGDVNEYSVEAKDESVTFDQVMSYVVWANGGVLDFRNGH